MTRFALPVLAVASLLCCAGGARPTLPGVDAGPPARFETVVIDAGHGGQDRGARGVHGLLEKELVLDVAKLLERRLRKRGLRVVMTRDEDETVSLEARTSIANDARADLFLSIHANSARSPKPRGIETYFASAEASDARAREVAERENRSFASGAALESADPLVDIIGDMIAAEKMNDSSVFAHLAQAELQRIEQASPRGVKQAPFVVLLGVQLPASLIEIGFLSHPQEERTLRTGRRREAIAAALESAVVAYAAHHDALRGFRDHAQGE